MSKPDPLRLDRAAYPLHRQIATRVSDMDGYGHLNAIRIGHYYEDARAAFYVAMEGAPKVRSLVGELTIRYLAEGFWPGDVEVGTGIARIGTASFTMGQALFQNGRCIGLCDTILVHTSEGASSPIPAAYRARLEEMMIRTPQPAE